MPVCAIIVFAMWASTSALAAEGNIAFAAHVTLAPQPAAGAEKALVDGNPSTSSAFEVGTEGEGTFTFSFDAPRRVLGLSLLQGGEVYFSTAFEVEGDADGDGQFEVPLGRVAEASAKEWVEFRWEPVALRAVRLRSVKGVSNGRRAHPCLAEVRIIGDQEAGDVGKAAAGGVPLATLPAVRPLRRETPLVVEGKGPALLAPADAAYSEAVSALTDGLAAAGIQLQRAGSVQEARPEQRTVICLGNMLNNPLLERLYWNGYTFVDALTPGAGKYLLHTVCDPYPYNGGQNVIVVGCSDAAGALPGVQRFLSTLDDGVLPYTVAGGPELLVAEEEAKRVAAARPDPTFCDFTKYSTLYLQTGCEVYAQKAVETLDTMASLYAAGGRRDVAPRGDRVKLPWPEETTSGAINMAWDAFEECPLITDDRRLAYTNAFLAFTRELVTHTSGFGALGQGDTISWNHTTFPLLGIHFGARYFQRYYKPADMPDLLAKARACFLAQAKSWKPQEDADSYMTLTPEHTYTYCLAEGEMGYFESGNAKAYADYVIGFCDNRGLSSGFGDSGVSSSPSLPQRALPVAYWWTKDPGYLWALQRYGEGKWANPFHQDVTPQEPDRFCGVNAFMLDPQVYDYTQTRPYYNEPLVAAEVSLEQAFDKISFRESWDPDAQYLLLDGFSRGKHLHYDGNSIIEFVEGSDRWLLDHDYLTRNTTEHSMLSVLRDGRCEELIPSMAGLAASVDLPGFGYTDTFVKGYNGCDWRRQILWAKGTCFLVADSVTPPDAGDFDLELTWKTTDNGGSQTVAGGDFVANRGADTFRTLDCTVLNDETASGGKALLMDHTTSQIAFGLDLPAGTYALSLVACGSDTSSDSLWVSMDLQPRQAFHVPTQRYGPSAGDPAHTTDGPKVTLEGDGPHTVLVSLRENPSVRVDRLVFTSQDGTSHAFETEDLPPVPAGADSLRKSFHIKSSRPVRSWVTNHERAGIVVPVSILHQRQGGKMDGGQGVRFASLLYTSLPGKRRHLQPVELSPSVVAIRGSHPALALLGDCDMPGLRAQAGAGLLSPGALCASGLRALSVGGLELAADEPVDVALDLTTGELTLRAGGPGELSLTGHGLQQRVPFAAGQLAAKVDVSACGPAVAAEVSRLVVVGPGTQAEEDVPAPAAAGPTGPAWTALSAGGTVRCLKTADLGAGPRLFLCRNASLHCLDRDGTERWRFDAAGFTSDVAFADIRPEPGAEVLLGSADANVYVLSAEGKLLDKRPMRGTPWSRSFGEQACRVFSIGAWNVSGDGRPEIAVTLSNFDLQVFSADWELLFKSDYALHGSTQLSFEDTDGDGKPETIVVGDKYGSSVGVSAQGKRVHQTYTSIGDVYYTVADVNGDGKAEVVTGSSTGDMAATPCGLNRQAIWRFDNFGYAVNRLKAADLNADGRSEVLVASGTGRLYALDGEGRVLWQLVGGMCVNDVVVLPGAPAHLAYCDEAGFIRVVSGAGEVLQELRTEAPPRLLAAQGGEADRTLVSALADGRVVAFAINGL